MFSVFDIPQPVVGMGHSMGGAQWDPSLLFSILITSFYSAICQPSLFTAVIGIDPIIEHTHVFVHASLPAAASARRKDIWPTLAEAQKYFTSRAFYSRMDRRCLDLHMVDHHLLPVHLIPRNTGCGNYPPRRILMIRVSR